MSNPQGPGKQGRKDAKAKASQPHHEAAARAPGRGEHSGQSARSHEQGHTPQHHRPGSSHSSQSHSSQVDEMEDE